jgi:hypothetical protein
MVIAYTKNIPDAPNNPSADQPAMKVNTNSIDTIVAVDHYSFDDASSGTHKQVTISDKNSAGAQTDPSSIIYTASGTASTFADLQYRNQNGIFPLSTIRAWATFAGASGTIISSQSINVMSVVKNSTGTYTVKLVANAVNSANIAILLSSTVGGSSSSISATYNVTGTGTFQIFTRAPATGALQDCAAVTFMVMQL